MGLFWLIEDLSRTSLERNRLHSPLKMMYRLLSALPLVALLVFLPSNASANRNINPAFSLNTGAQVGRAVQASKVDNKSLFPKPRTSSSTKLNYSISPRGLFPFKIKQEVAKKFRPRPPSIKPTNRALALVGKYNTYEALMDRPILALMDLTAIMAFAVIGKASHVGIGAFDTMDVAMTAFPFLLAWFSLAPLIGCYNPRVTRLASKEFKRRYVGVYLHTLKGWLVSVPMGCLLRAAMVGHLPSIPFVFVSMISTAVLLTGLRSLYAKVNEEWSYLSEFHSF